MLGEHTILVLDNKKSKQSPTFEWYCTGESKQTFKTVNRVSLISFCL